ncbi:MAG: T9SS type A sorting domain-containing protein [Candidatus Zixiibacteriota bacterium]
MKESLVVVAAVCAIAAPLSVRGAQLRLESRSAVMPAVMDSVSIYVDSLEAQIGGYRLLVSLTESAYSIVNVRPGELPIQCGWEYFTWHTLPHHPLEMSSHTGLLEITAQASATSGYIPACYSGPSPMELARITLLMGSDGPYHRMFCQTEPLRFFWRDCDDNVLLSVDGDTALVAFELKEQSAQFPSNDTVSYPFPGYGVPGSGCASYPGRAYVPSLTAVNGTFDFVCPETWSLGDINLNGFSHESADAVVFTNYFMHGLAAFQINIAGQIAQSDVNQDGLTLTLADLQYLFRVIIGDAPPVPGPSLKPAPPSEYSATLEVAEVSGLTNLTIRSDAVIGALYVKLLGIDGVSPTQPNAEAGWIGDTVTFLLINSDGSSVLIPGTHLLGELGGTATRIVSADAVDAAGRVMIVHTDNEHLPRLFSLAQNYPNPFNPTTTISFDLPVTSAWRLTIYNVTGQEVAVYSGESVAGRQEVVVDGVRLASGVYMYRLEANGRSETRKMILLK